MDGEAIKARRRWLPRWLRIALALFLLLLLLAFAVLWVMRVRLATDYIDAELERRGVTARYEVKRIGFGSQIFENLSIGDPRRPDLTARRVEVRIGIGLGGPRIGLITARGVRMRGRVEGGRLTLGQVDRLLPPPSGEPFRLPDQRVDVKDAAVALETPAGEVALALSGRGNLADGFRGGLAVVARALRIGGCTLERPVARFTLRVTDRRPRVRGPAAMARLSCGDALVAERPLLALRALLEPGLDGWRGSSAIRVARLSAGRQSLSDFQGRLTFGGNAEQSRGSIRLESGEARAGAFRAGAAALDGDYVFDKSLGVSFEGEVEARRLVVREEALAALVGPLRGARGTPVGPIADSLSAALVRAARGGAEARARLRLSIQPRGGRLDLAGLDVEARSGARLSATGGEGIAFEWPSGSIGVNGGFALSGGGLPEARFVLNQPRVGGPVHGAGRIATIEAGGARLALDEIGFTAAPDGRTSFRTAALIDGPFEGGRVSGLALPLQGRFGRGGFALGETCVTAGFRALQFQTLRLGPSRLPLCPIRGALIADGRFGAELRAPRLAGRLGASPIQLASRRVRVDSDGFRADSLSIRLGAAAGVNRLDIAALTGRFGSGGAGGGFDGLDGDLANVPLRAGGGSGRWSLRGGALALDGRITLADKQAPARFQPLTSGDFRLGLADNRIRATGTLVHPGTGTPVAVATIRHDLGSGAGDAVLDIDSLRFAANGLQPDALTPLTVGVVALVDGAISGQGRIEWDGRGVRSTGSFATDDMDLAAPFGPVEGLATRIDFTDLLGLTSAPGQQARVRLIRAGIDVHDGEVRYQLRPNYNVAIEGARWPFSGGTLALAPTVLDFSRESTKYLTFQVEGLDAARFVQMMEFSNIAATGTYDGVIPMQFTDRGGRIVGGRLVARPGGGTLSYIGELTQENLGAYGALAFDALKSMRYSRLELTLDGALDGEFLTRIDMDGIARDLDGTRQPSGGIAGIVVGRVLDQVSRIPFHFNIRVQGPFRALVATTRSFQDPSELIRAALPGLMERGTVPERTVPAAPAAPVPGRGLSPSPVPEGTVPAAPAGTVPGRGLSPTRAPAGTVPERGLSPTAVQPQESEPVR